MIYKNRQDAGRQLAEKLMKFKDENPIIIALPRGGVVTGYEAAKMLHAPLDVMITRKLGAPFQLELAIGAIAPNDVRILNLDAIRFLGISKDEMEEIIRRETKEMHRRIKLYRGDLPPLDLSGKTVIIVDDGLATGVTAGVAVLSIKQMTPEKIILAVPVSPIDTAEKFREEVDEFICLSEPPDFFAVGQYYDDFAQVTDEEVISLLELTRKI
ncbi:MAG TPA: phosphoribosyltransferase [Cyanobacteria bacterium UBA9971]|nr:phosphoribosyltransferase [Cyanobacteria bacterium UBA9971]